jgi:3'(2'), 5'-bisphosphate nucleotidase
LGASGNAGADASEGDGLIENGSELRLAELLPQVVAIARRAGDAIMKVYQELNPEIEWKQDKSPLTQADLASHRVICEGLAALSLQFPILSEESAEIPFEVRQSWKTFWLVDPLDGTKEFLNRNGEFTVNIALISEGFPVLGVVHVPVGEKAYLAAEGAGARKVEHGVEAPIRVSGVQSSTPRVVVSRLHGGGMEQTRVDLETIGVDASGCTFIPMGSSLKFCVVAEGAADLYLRNGPTMEWDTAAAQCVVEMAGGMVSDLGGKRLRYNKPVLLNPGFLASAAR